MRRKTKKGGVTKAIFLLLLFIGYINLSPPVDIFSFLVFYLLFSLSLLATFALFVSTARSIVWIAILLIYLVLRQNHVDNFINTILLLGIFVTLEIYFRK